MDNVQLNIARNLHKIRLIFKIVLHIAQHKEHHSGKL